MADNKKSCDQNRSVTGAKVTAKIPMSGKGVPISTFNVPGVSRPHGTPSWVSGPAKAAARKAK